jgi:hypothetical protein
VGHIRRNEKRFPFVHHVVDYPIPFPNSDLNVAFQLVKVLLRIDQMEIVAGIRPFDDHDEKIATIVKVLIAHRRLEFVSILLNPALKMNWRLHGRWGVAWR